MRNFLEFGTKAIISIGIFLGIFVGEVHAKNFQGAFPSVFNLSNINGINGFAIDGVNLGAPNKYTLGSTSGSGDINGDGINDFIIGAPYANENSGQVYVIFGSNHKWPVFMNITNLNGVNGFAVNGIHSNDTSGYSVSIIDDVNGDNVDDVLIGAPHEDGSMGQSYVVFGGSHKWPAVINLTGLNGNNGFAMNGQGFSVSSAGDVNADGIADILIGIYYRDYNERKQCLYVVFGAKTNWPAFVDLKKLDGTNGFVINCPVPSVFYFESHASNLGDINDDGIDDIIVELHGGNNVGKRDFVLFGKETEWPAVFELSGLDGTNGFIINRLNTDLYFGGRCISGVGDINDDGINDILMSAYSFSDWKQSGQTYVIFGSRQVWPKAINVTDLNGDNGFTVNGFPFDGSNQQTDGFFINKAKDVNGDGIDDILIGSRYNNRGSVVFGSKEEWPAMVNLDKLDGFNGFVMDGIEGNDRCGLVVNGIGDINGDGKNDVLIECPNANYGEGRVYIIFGE